MMKRFFVVAILFSMFASAVWADDISIYADPSGSACVLSVVLPPPSINSVYIVHRFNTGSIGAQFRVDDTSGLLAVSQMTPYVTLGTWNVDLSLAFGGCVIGDHVLMTLNFFWLGTAFNCEHQLVTVPAPTSLIPGALAVVDCATPANPEVSSGGQMFFGPDGHDCNPTHCGVNAVSERTWGAVKALYR